MEERRKQNKKSFLTKSWVLRFVTSDSRHTHVFRIKPMHLFLGIFVFLSSILGMVRYNTHQIQSKEEKLTVLEDNNVKQELIIDRLKVEKKQIAALLEKQNDEMATKLEKIEKKSNEVRKIVGLRNEPTRVTSKKRSLKGSRSGNVNLLRLRADFKKINNEIESTEQGMKKLEKTAVAYQREMEKQRFLRMLETVPSLWPASGSLVSEFGMRMHPIYGYMRFHSGIDISAPYGSPIYSGAYGTVTYSGYYSGYGYTIMVDHGNGMVTLYGHCSTLLAREGEVVRKGQLVARVGSTGVSTGPHLHYEVQIAGTAVDPVPYLDYTGTRLAKLKQDCGFN